MSQRWRAVIGLLGLAGLVIATLGTVDDVREQALPSVAALGVALVLELVALFFIARGWIALFPPTADRAALARGLYTSQLTKYLPAGGFVQAASQVALSSQNGVAAAAVRLPIFSLCTVVAGATVGAGLALDSDLPGWGRALAALGLLTNAALDRRVLQALLRMARRVTSRIPADLVLPSQGAVLRCYAASLVDMVAYCVAYAVLLGDLVDIEPWSATVAFAAAWALGYLVLPVPSGLGVRELVLLAALPGVPTGSLLAASVAHRLLSFVAEVTLAFAAHSRELLARHRRAAMGQTGGSAGKSLEVVD